MLVDAYQGLSMAKDDFTGDDGNGGDGGGVAEEIRTTVKDPEVLQKIQQRLSDAGCTQVSRTVTDADGGFVEYVVEARCNADISRQVINFILDTNRPRDGGVNPREPVQKPNNPVDRLERRLQRGETIAEVLLNPPENFGAKSRDLAARLAETIQNYQFLGKTIVAGVVLILATANPADTLATRGFELEGVAEALSGIPAICRGQMRQLIELELAKQPPPFPHDEGQFWEQLDASLKK
jgi:hypothetical protein